VQQQFRFTYFLFVDEKSMVGLQMAGAFDARLEQALVGRREVHPFDPFVDGRFDARDGGLVPIRGGLRRFALVVLGGDLGQLAPVKDTKWWLESRSAMGLRGNEVVASIDFSWSLLGSVRQEGDSTYGALLWRAHEGECLKEDCEALNRRCLSSLPKGEQATFSGAMRLYPTKAETRSANLKRMRDGYGVDYPCVANVPARHNVERAAIYGDEHAMGLQSKGWYVVGAPHMLTSNLWTKAGLTNGMVGELLDLVADESPWMTCPSVALLAVDSEKLPTGSGLSCADPERSVKLWGRCTCCDACSGWATCAKGPEAHVPRKIIVPVPAVTREWHDAKGKLMTRTMLPLRLAFAITFHKSQGMTIVRVVVNLGDAESHPGGTFTALSRVPGFANLALEKAVNHDRLGRLVHSRAIQIRKEYERRKWGPLEDSACRHFAALLRVAGEGCSPTDADDARCLGALAAQLHAIASASL